MGDEKLRHGGTEAFGPAEQVGTIGVGREAADGVDLRVDVDGFAGDAHGLGAVDDAASQRAVRLVTHEDDVIVGVPDAVFEVMDDAPAVAHTAAGHDYAEAEVIDGLRLLARGNVADVLAGEGIAAVAAIGLDLLRHQIEMIFVKFADLDAHRRVEEHRHAATHALAAQQFQLVHDALGAVDDEGGDEHLAFLFGEDVLHQRLEFVASLLIVFVLAIAVGGLDDDVIGVGDLRGRASHDGLHGAEVPGEDEAHDAPFFLDEDFQNGAAEDVPGVAEADRHAGEDLEARVVIDGREQFFGGVGLFLAVDGLRRRAAAGVLGALPFGVFAHEAHRVVPQDLGQFDSRQRRVNFAAEALLDQLGDAAGMVDVRVRQQHRVDRIGGVGERIVVGVLPFALMHAAVHEETMSAGFEQIVGAGHFFGGAAEFQQHEQPSFAAF